jgi:hypothetical protein
MPKKPSCEIGITTISHSADAGLQAELAPHKLPSDKEGA